MARIVIWDDQCSFCASWIAVARRLDWLGAHRYLGSSDPEAYRGTGVTPEEAAQAVQLSAPGVRAAGYDAIRLIALRLPLTMLLAPLLWLPPLPWIGRRVYRRVAARRSCRFVQ